MQALSAYTGNNLLDMTFRLTHARAPQLFTGRGKATGFTYTYTIAQPPTVQLRVASNTQPHNVTLDLPKVDMTVTPTGGAAMNLSCPATARGLLRVVNGVLSVRELTVTLVNPGLLGAVMQQAVDTRVLPGLQAALRSVRLPQLNDVMNDDLAPNVREADVLNGDVLRVGARLGSSSGLAVASALPAAERAQLNSGSSTDARLAVMASDEALTKLMQEEVGTITRSGNQDLANAAAVRTTFRADRLSLNVANGTGTVTMRVRLTLRAGLNIPFVGWRWASIAVPTLVVAVQNSVGAQGTSAFVRVGNIAAINVVLNLPGWLGPVAGVIRNAVNGIANAFRGVINGIINGMVFPIPVLGNVIPGTDIPAQLSFVANSVGYVGNALRVVVRVRA